jgi:hypothetical protein
MLSLTWGLWGQPGLTLHDFHYAPFGQENGNQPRFLLLAGACGSVIQACGAVVVVCDWPRNCEVALLLGMGQKILETGAA